MSPTPSSAEALPRIRIYPKLKAWDNAVMAIADMIAGDSLRGALKAAIVAARRSYPQGIFWLNPTLVVMSYKDQSLAFSGNVKDGLEQASPQFAVISENNHRFRWFSPSYWISRHKRKRLVRLEREYEGATHEYNHHALRRLLKERTPVTESRELALVYLFLQNLAAIVDGKIYYNSYLIQDELEIMICRARVTYWMVIDFKALNLEWPEKFPVEM